MRHWQSSVLVPRREAYNWILMDSDMRLLALIICAGLIFPERDKRQENEGMREERHRMEKLIQMDRGMSAQRQTTVHIWAYCWLILLRDFLFSTLFLTQHVIFPSYPCSLHVFGHRGQGGFAFGGRMGMRAVWVPVPPALGHNLVCLLGESMPNGVKVLTSHSLFLLCLRTC